MNLVAAEPVVQDRLGWDVGETQIRDRGWLSAIAQVPIENVELIKGKVFKYKGGILEVVDIHGDDISLRRLGGAYSDLDVSEDVRVSPTTDPLEFFQNPISETALENPLKHQPSGPTPESVLRPGQNPARDRDEKKTMLGDELKTIHPPLIDLPQESGMENRHRASRMSHRMPDESFVREDVEKLYNRYFGSVFASKLPALEFLKQITDNYIQFQTSVVERYQMHYPELVHDLLAGYRQVTEVMAQNHVQASIR